MTARAALAHPIALLAIAVLAFNDHVLKVRAPGIVSGKLSDVAGMICFPLLLAFAIDLVRRRDSRRTIAGAVIATAVAFAAIKTLAPAAELYRVGLGLAQWPFRALAGLPFAPVHLTRDPTDLVALSALAVPLWLSQRVQVGDQVGARRGVEVEPGVVAGDGARSHASAV